MQAERWRLGWGLVAAVMALTSCTQQQIEQVIQNTGRNALLGQCPTGNALMSAAPEFCLALTELRLLNNDSEADVSLTLVNRTGHRVYVALQGSPVLTDNNGTKWVTPRVTGISHSHNSPLALEPNVNAPVTMSFRQNSRNPSGLTFSMHGEIAVMKVDSRGQSIPGQPQVVRGFNFSGIRLRAQAQ